MEAELPQGSGNLLLVNVAMIQAVLLTGLPHFQYQKENRLMIKNFTEQQLRLAIFLFGTENGEA